MTCSSQSLLRSAFTTFCVLALTTVLPRPLVAAQTNEWLPPAPEGRHWRLAWSDEFDGVQIDESKWEILGDWKRRDGFWVKDDSYLDGKGNLILRTKKDGDRYTCGAVRTRGASACQMTSGKTSPICSSEQNAAQWSVCRCWLARS